MLLVPLYGKIPKLSLTSLFLTAILIFILVKNKQHLFKSKSHCSKLLLILFGVAISWWFSIKVEQSNQSKPCTEVILGVVLEGNPDGQVGQNLIAAKVIKATKANQRYIGKKVMLKFKNRKELKYNSNILIIKGILTNKNKSGLLINVNKYNQPLNKAYFYKAIFNFQNQFFYKIENISNLNQGAKSFLIAMTTGNKTYFKKNEILLFIKTGTVHLFAVSGLHFGMIYLILKVILDLILKYKILKSCIIVILLYIYLVFINESISATRAFYMISLWEAVALIKKKSSALSIVSIAFLFAYTLNPYSISSVGFQLSFSIVLVIIWFFNTNLKGGTSIYLKQLYKTFQASFASFIGSVIIILLTFKQFVPVSIFANILFVPLAFPIMIICLVYCLLFFLFKQDYPWFLNISYNISCKILSIFDVNYIYINNISINFSKGILLVLPLFIIFVYNFKFNFLFKSLIIIFVQIFTYIIIKFVN